MNFSSPKWHKIIIIAIEKFYKGYNVTYRAAKETYGHHGVATHQRKLEVLEGNFKEQKGPIGASRE